MVLLDEFLSATNNQHTKQHLHVQIGTMQNRFGAYKFKIKPPESNGHRYTHKLQDGIYFEMVLLDEFLSATNNQHTKQHLHDLIDTMQNRLVHRKSK